MDAIANAGMPDDEPSQDDAQALPASACAPLREQLVLNYDSLVRRLVRRLGCPELASDCLHDAWLRLGELRISPAICSPDAYIYRVACNLAVDRLRSDRISRCTHAVDIETQAAIDECPGPAEAAEARSELDVVIQALRGLPPRHREILIALRIDERTRQEVAATYHLSLRTVDTILRQALQHCALPVQRPIAAGVSSPRRPLPERWRAPMASTAARGI